MARLLLFGLIAFAGYAAWRAVRRRPRDRRPAIVPTLRRDPETGVYRPLKDGE